MKGDLETNSVFHELMDAFAQCLPAESVRALANFKLSEVTLDRLELLGRRANEGALSPEESADYRAFIELSELIANLRLRALASA